MDEVMLKRLSLCGSLLFAAATVMVSCSEPNPDAPSDRSVHAAAWVNPAAVDSHGADVTRNGSESCTACHGPSLEGSGSLPGCTECHFDAMGSRIPPGSSWTHGSQPHSQFEANSKVCNNCHTVYREFGLPPASCHDCHAGGAAHPLGSAWLDARSPTFHGIDAKRNAAQCAACHGSDYLGGSSGISCYSCHFGPSGTMVPQGRSWIHGTVPHGSLSSYVDVCNLCHGLDRTYGNGPSSCHDCHDDD